MQILALETSTESGSCALWQDGAVIERICPPGRSHSETLLPLVRELMAEGGISVGQLDAIAFDAGPGAFTGLRVACGAAQGLAVAAGLPLVPVVSLEVMAATSGADRVISLLDARMGEVYGASYQRREDGYELFGEILVRSPDDIDMPGTDWLACGNALTAYPALAGRLNAAGIALMPAILPEASWLARLGAIKFAAGQGIDPALAVPLYIRDKVAKTIRERLSEGGRA
jgi:tRNA threonylcarbamoyladenosine biosynthesis protein TsaB